MASTSTQQELQDQFLSLIATGKLPSGEFLPSVRQVAQELQVNPMTVSKAYSLLKKGCRPGGPVVTDTAQAQPGRHLMGDLSY